MELRQTEPRLGHLEQYHGRIASLPQSRAELAGARLKLDRLRRLTSEHESQAHILPSLIEGSNAEQRKGNHSLRCNESTRWMQLQREIHDAESALILAQKAVDEVTMQARYLRMAVAWETAHIAGELE